MSSKFNYTLVCLTLIFLASCSSSGLRHDVAGSPVEDTLDKMKAPIEGGAFIPNDSVSTLEKLELKKSADNDVLFKTNPDAFASQVGEREALKDVGYKPLGSMEKSETYQETDKAQMGKEMRKNSRSAINLIYIKNKYNYESENDIINRTISQSYQHVQTGTLLLRNDRYFFRSLLLNSFWSLGGGIGYNSGHGQFISGEESQAVFRLYEIPIDLGLGAEIPVWSWFKVAGTAGLSGMGLVQNRSDYQNHESGKNKFQFSYGQFASAQFKVSLSGISKNLSYDLFTEGSISNMLINFELRYQDYRHFQDAISISGTSYGLGFTFEYL